jgi:ABC-type lipoprotein release transport system permease subunit
VATLGRIAQVPLFLAIFLGLIALGTLAQVLVTSVRRRRRDLAMLKTLGFVQRQIRGTVGWQATTLAVVALVIGVPVGIAAGRWAWRAFAEQIGVVPAPHIGGVSLLVVVPATILLALAVSFVPALLAARTRPATVLRSE